MNTKNQIHTLYSVVITLLSLYLLNELNERNTELKTETEMKWEYSLIIDSLLNENLIEREGIRHWNEELERDYAPHYKTNP